MAASARSRRSTLARLVAATAVVVLLAPACGAGESHVVMLGGSEATPAYLAAAADRVGAEPLRFEQIADLGLPGMAPMRMPLVSGAVDGDRVHLVMDLGATVDAIRPLIASTGDTIPPGLDLDALVMEMIVTDDALYLRAPLLGVFAAFDPTTDLGPFAALGDGWGRFGLAELGEAAIAELSGSLTGTSVAEPSALVGLVRDAADVESLGRGIVRGVDVAGLRAEVTLRDLLVAQGVDTATMLSDAYTDVSISIEVWIDGDDRIRRVVVDVDVETLLASAMAGPLPGGGMLMSTTLDLFDHGDPTIRIEAPAESVDLTAEVAALLAEERAARR